jgi:hypothetical protein
MTGPFKIPVMLLAIGVSALAAQAQSQQQKPPRLQVQVGGHNIGRPHLGDWLRLNRGKSFDQQKKSLESDPDFKKLPPDRQEKLKERLLNFNNLPADQQDRILKRIEKFEHMSPQQRAQARALWDRMRLLPEERRKIVRQQIHTLAGQTPEQRQSTMASEPFGKQFNPEERDIIQRGLELNDAVPSAGPEENEAPQ